MFFETRNKVEKFELKVEWERLPLPKKSQREVDEICLEVPQQGFHHFFHVFYRLVVKSFTIIYSKGL